MKKSRLILLVGLPLVCVLFMGQMCGSGQTNQTAVAPLNYSDQQISMDYPANWTKEPDSEGIIVFLSAPNEQDSVNVISVDLSASPMNLKDFSELSIQGIEETIPGYTLVRQGETTLAGNKAQDIVFTGTKDGTTLKFYQVWTIVDDVAYAITYTASEENFANLKPKVDAMIASFQIKNQKK